MNNYYYDIQEDIKNYPTAWVYIVVGGRNTGKTYGSLCYALDTKQHFVFVKRTMDDVNLLCSGSGRLGQKQSEFGLDLSPFKSINRDRGTNIKAFSIKKGFGGFWKCNEEGEPVGDPIGYILALNAVQKFKGFDMSECSMIIFDEFIPQPWERVNRKEGEQLMDLYKTVGRDREHRGLPALKLICLANATKASNPVTNVLEVTDQIVNMDVMQQDLYYDDNREVFIHMIHDNEAFQEKEAQSSIYKAMADTNWGRMALENQFGYDDFSCIGKQRLKGFRCWVRYKYKNKFYFVYRKDSEMYVCKTPSTKYQKDYDLDTENGQKSFYLDALIKIRSKCIDGKVMFQDFSMYDLLMNYKKYFVV